MMGFGGMGVAGWFGPLTMTLLWLAVVVLALWAVRGLFPTPQRSPTATAHEVLRRRYARGEISAAEFEQAKHTLGVVYDRRGTRAFSPADAATRQERRS